MPLDTIWTHGRVSAVAKKAKKGLCTYCLRWREVTRDHVPPKAFFAKHRPDDLITVPACGECHRPTSDDDEYTASVIALRMESGDIPDAQARSPRSSDGPFLRPELTRLLTRKRVAARGS